MNGADIALVHAKIDDSLNHLWFSTKPQMEIATTDNEVCAYLKKLHTENEVGADGTEQPNKGVLKDPVLSYYLKAHAYYLAPSIRNELIKLINKSCNIEISKDTDYFKIDTNDMVFIFAKYFRKSGERDTYPESQCTNMQQAFNNYIQQQCTNYYYFRASALIELIYDEYGDRFNNQHLIYNKDYYKKLNEKKGNN